MKVKKFEFSLTKMQRYKKQILDKEKGVLAVLQRKRNEIEQEILKLQQFEAKQSAELIEKQKKGMSSSQLAGYRFFCENIRMQIDDLKHQLEQLQKQVDAQIQVVTKASQELKSIDKLEEKQLEEYRLEVMRAENEEITEFITMGL